MDGMRQGTSAAGCAGQQGVHLRADQRVSLEADERADGHGTDTAGHREGYSELSEQYWVALSVSFADTSPRGATISTAASGGSKEKLLGQRSAGCERM